MKTLRSPYFEARKVCGELWYKEAWNAKAAERIKSKIRVNSD